MKDCRIQIGISTCPNDTFAFHALLNRKIDTGEIDFEFQLMDVEELNLSLLDGKFDVAKASFHAALRMADDLSVLSSGSALGFGVGPLLLAAQADTAPGDSFLDSDGTTRLPLVGCPGEFTTATLLYRLFYPQRCEMQQMIFSDIMPALIQSKLDFGVCIHEGRFTYRQHHLSCVVDLGTRWETETGVPLPLGGILARKNLGDSTLAKVQNCIRKSIQYGLEHRQETVSTMRKYAQEFSEEVLMAHVETYVNDWTLELGDVGRSALTELARRFQAVNPQDKLPELEIVDGQV